MNAFSFLKHDTIAAICTPPGRGGVGIVRVSGPQAKPFAQKLTGLSPRPRYAHFADFLNCLESPPALIDQGLLLFFPNPHSFTGEDVVEFQAHGGPVVLDALLNTLLKLGARLAEPGEFSLRAYLNGKIDLLQAEAIADLIDASSTAAQQCALQSLQGAFSHQVKALNTEVIQLRVWVEAALDFPEEEIDFISDSSVLDRVLALQERLDVLFNTAKQGSLLKEGKTVVIVGEPNVGKSSLLNKLAEKDLAIVTNIPGTTRDLIKEHLSIDGFPLHVIDTAGIRDSLDEVELEGIRRAKEVLSQADIILHMQSALNSQDAFSEQMRELLTVYKDKTLFVVNKIDLNNQMPAIENDTIYISVRENQGIDLLKQALKAKMGAQAMGGVFSARRRHLAALEQAQTHLFKGHEQLVKYRAAELLAQELRFVSNALETLTGEFSTEDLLGEIFSSFCIGK